MVFYVVGNRAEGRRFTAPPPPITGRAESRAVQLDPTILVCTEVSRRYMSGLASKPMLRGPCERGKEKMLRCPHRNRTRRDMGHDAPTEVVGVRTRPISDAQPQCRPPRSILLLPTLSLSNVQCLNLFGDKSSVATRRSLIAASIFFCLLGAEFCLVPSNTHLPVPSASAPPIHPSRVPMSWLLTS
jgi:hypothetical protein